jgi:hypothetical protein
LTLLRVVQPKENEKMAVGQTYDVSSVARVTEPVTRLRLQEALTTSSSKESKESLRKVLNIKLSMLNSLIMYLYYTTIIISAILSLDSCSQLC